MKTVRLLALSLMLSVAAPAWAEPPTDIRESVEALRKKVGAAGVSIAIVEDGKTTLSRGWGVRKIGERAPVDAQTIFQTGSTGKAMTAAALAILVDEGKIAWDDPVIKHMPWFRMHDAWVTREITIRDLLVHRSGLGLGQGDLMFVPRTHLTRKQTVEHVAYLKPKTSFRSAYAYDNILYTVAGQLIEEVTGQTWEAFMRTRILRAGGMKNATSDSEDRFRIPNRSWPHARLSGPLRGLGPQAALDERDELGRNGAPAGGLALSADDMAAWLKIQLAHGALPNGKRLFSEKQAAEMWAPVTPMPINPLPDSLKPAQPMQQAYALGWQVQDYRGHRIISHGGGVFGSITRVVMIPDKKCRLCDHDEQRGQRDAARPHARTARSLSGPARLWLDREMGGLVSGAARRREGVPRTETGVAGQVGAVALADRLRRALPRSLVWRYRYRADAEGADDRLYLDPADGGATEALAV